ncbi:CTP synthase [Bifidobacterium avesanii]|uniref:CTP synthase n=2 Tax=Bifidobacterium avesanii TaxID=1798157 RepID=A0A7K3TGP4_9BIFI|nr:CTP synthase [Bifidobacterium avesanii]NEG78267.1 CTP synthase [Bifidobacterium avesanii]
MYAEASHWRSLNPNERALHIIRTLSSLHPHWIFGGPSAALVHGLDCPYPLSRAICRVISPDAWNPPKRSGLVDLCRTRPDVVRVDGINVTSVESTVFDCVIRFLPSYSLGFADSAIRLGRTDAPRLLRFCRGQRREARWDKAEQVLLLADGASENGGESQCRGALYECGCARPRLQVPVPCVDVPGRTHRPDMLWTRDDGSYVACEFDGTRKYVDPAMIGNRDVRQVVAEERRRAECLGSQGIDVFRLFYGNLNETGELLRLLDEYRVPMDEGIRRRLGVWPG